MQSNSNINSSKESCYKRLPELFSPFKAAYYFEFNNGKIISPCEYSSIESIYAFILFILPFVFLFYVSLTYTDTNTIPTSTVKLFWAVWFFIIIVLKNVLIKVYRVINYEDRYIVTDVLLLGIRCAQVNKIPFDSIIQVSNNVSLDLRQRVFGFTTDIGEYLFKVSLLLKDGKIYNLYSLGSSQADYQYSLKIARAISQGLDIPLTVCNDGYQLKSVITYSGYAFALKKFNEKKEPRDIFRAIKVFFIIFISVAVLMFVMYVYSMATSKTGIQLYKIRRDIKYIFGIK